MRILIIEDEVDFASILARGLRQEGYAVDIAADGERGHELATVNTYDLLLLDLNLPGMDGIEVCRRLRKSHPNLLIIMVTARGLTGDVISGLDTGADDYMVKPFSLPELLARLRAILRRGQGPRDVVLRFGPLTLDRAMKTVWCDNHRLELTRKEFGILEYLMCRPGEIVSVEMLMEHVWDSRANSFSKSVKVHIHSLRQKLANVDGISAVIETVVGQGYRLARLHPNSESEP